MSHAVVPEPTEAPTSRASRASRPSSVSPRLDRHFWLALLLAAAIIIPRSMSIAWSHNESMDAATHLRLGFRHLMGDPARLMLAATDAPLGQMLLCLPMAATGCYPSAELHVEHWPPGWDMPGVAPPGEPPRSEKQARYERTIRRTILYGNRLAPETILLLIGAWKAVLFLPCVAVAFQWARTLYGLRAGWLAAALLAVEPTIAANIPIIALDSLGVTAIVVACFCIWRYFERETTGRLIAVAVAMAAAMLIKHTAVILPGVFLAFAVVYWIVRPWRAGQRWPQLRARMRPRLNVLLTLGVVWSLAAWTLLLFDYSTPIKQCFGVISDEKADDFPGRDLLFSVLERRWPLGTYVGSFVSGYLINRTAQNAFLWGEVSPTGWWYYFPVLTTYKVPLGLLAVLALGLASLAWVRPRRGEGSLAIPMLAWTLFLMSANMNYSFRHFLPAYLFMLIAATRCVADRGADPGGEDAGESLSHKRRTRTRWIATAVAWTGVVLGAVHVASFHPDYLSYVNFPRRDIQYQITDSNLDWGQAIRQIPEWLAAHPQYADKPVGLHPRWDGAFVVSDYYLRGLDGRLRHVARGKPAPPGGLLIISPVWVCGVYDWPEPSLYAFLRQLEPVGWVGHAMPVYDLDQLPRREPTSAAGREP